MSAYLQMSYYNTRIFQKIGCGISDDSDYQMRQQCFGRKSDGSGFDQATWKPGCDTAELVEKNGFVYQIGGPPQLKSKLCKTGLVFAMPYEVGFVLNFTLEDNYPRGCGPLDGNWRFGKGKPLDPPEANRMYVGE